MWYIADIGTYETGTCFKFYEDSDTAALSRAFSVRDRRFMGSDVIQLRRCKGRPTKPLALAEGVIVWDYMNGWLQ